MFKLLKDLTRAPEPLNPVNAGGEGGSDSVPYATRSRSSSTAAPPGPAQRQATPSPLPPSENASTQLSTGVSSLTLEDEQDKANVEETDRDAIQVVGLVHALQDVSGTMYYVETFSELLSIPGTFAARRAFRRHDGFQRLVDALDVLAWRPRPDDFDADHWQVEEVQRAEGQRLCFEVLAWAMGDREGEKAFNDSFGYASLLPAVRKLSQRPEGLSALDPDPRVLGLLLTHLLGNNYVLLSLFNSDIDSLLPDNALESKLGDVTLRWAAALPLVWAYVWGLDSADTDKGLPDALAAGDFEGGASDLQTKLITLTFRILSLAARQLTDLLLTHSHLPHLPDFLLTRLYGWQEERPVEVTFPPREEWYQNADSEDVPPRPEWIAPTEAMRSLYLALLQRLLDAGVTTDQTWRLFSLVRKLPPSPEPASTEVETPASSAPDTPSRRTKPTLKVTLPGPEQEGETLDNEVMDLIKGAMKSRAPDAFVFRGGQGSAAGGLEIHDLGRTWPNSTKGFIFTCWLYISKLNNSVTLLHLSQAGEPHPLLHVRVLENSQICISSHTDGQAGEPEDIICGAPDALIPHNQWIHFGVGCRKGRSTAGGGGEARIFINGQRVGVVRVPYPTPKVQAAAAPHLHKQHHGSGIRASVGRVGHDGQSSGGDETSSGLGRADTEWMLGRSLLLEEVVSEELVMLMYHLGPRYYGNFQDALNKFLTYDGATSIHLYLHGMSQAAQQKALALLPANSALVRAIRVGPAIPEENIMLSLCAKDVLDRDHILNAAVPHASRAKDFRYGRAKLVGTVFPFVTSDLDVAVSTVGGGVAVLKLVDLATNTDELTSALTILHDMIQESWSASEEMERIHGFELLAAILRPKMASMMDIKCTDIIMSILGISMDEPELATVHNSAAYRALGLEFELWSLVPLDVLNLYFSHFDYLLSKSQYRRYNLLRTFQKSNIVRKLLFAVRSGLFEEDALPPAVATLRLALVSRWSAEESIKPIFAYLVSALCQNVAPAELITTAQPTQSQLPASLILDMMADVLHNQKRLVKLNKSLSLHRLLVVFLQSNPAPFVAYPCLDILAHCLSTPGLESFQRSFESEGGFALLAKVLAPIWNDAVQETIFRMVFGDTGPAGASLACPPAMQSLMTALDALLQAATDTAGGGMGNSMSRSIGSIRSLAMTTPLTAVAPAPADDDADSDDDAGDDDRLEKLLNKLAAVYRQSSAFRRAVPARRIESMLPSMVDFAAVSASSSQPERVEAQRAAAVNWLTALVDLSKAPSTVIVQLKLLVEQLKASSTLGMSSSQLSLARSPPPPSSSLTRPSLLGTSVGSFTTTTNMTGSTTIRRRPSTDAGLRPVPGGDKSLQLRRVLTGESILREEQDKNAAWRMIILSTDAQKFATMTLDRKEHWHRLSQVEWPRQVATLRAENGVWADRNVQVTWRLDGSEGPLRMRNRLERVDVVAHSGPLRGRNKLRDAIPSTDELSSAVSRINNAPWEDPFALALGDAAPIAEEDSPVMATPSQPSQPTPADGEDSDEDSYVDVDDSSSNKMRLVAKALQAGDVVEEAHNIVRIVGVDALPGLLILGSRNLYLIDGLVQTPDGKVVEADQAPKDVLSIPSGTLADLDPTDQRSHHWPYADVVETNKRAFLFRDVALELYFSDKQNFLVVFKDKRARSAVVSKMQAKLGTGDPLSRSILGAFVLDLARASRGAQLEDMTRRWQSREISNFAYLQMLNQHANRTPNDVTQYPVFPWVLADYSSQILDLTRQGTYRDLSLPMGALTPARKDAAVERYQATEGVGETPFHYGTHYTSSMIVCGFMIRVSPFTEIFLALQGGTFDLADRLFSSVPRAWDSASHTNRGDVRELIPEFFYSPMFLVNLNHHDFGKKQVSGDSVDDVALPPWALDDPLLFVHWNREALESDYVSRHLSEWIDLTFGYKQRDAASYNCFHPLSYRGAVDLDRMKDEGEKASSTAIIHNFGQTPFQIFKTPHPQRLVGSRNSLPAGVRFGVAEHWQLLLRSALPITEVANRIHHILEPLHADAKPGVQQQHRLIVPGHHQLSVQYGFADLSLRLYFQDTTHRLVYIVEGIEVQYAAFASPTLLITVSPLGVITAWRLIVKGSGARRGDSSLSREATLRGARSVTCIAVSTAWSILVTGSEDGTAAVWDMNRLRYTRALKTPRSDPIKFMTVNESNGHIVLASERYLYMYSLNGHPIAATSVDGGRMNFPSSLGMDAAEADVGPTEPQRFTGGLSFLKREFLRWGDLFVVGVGSTIALYRCVPGVRRFQDQEVEPWRLVKQGILYGSDEHGAGECTAVRFIGEALYAGFEPPADAAKHHHNKHLLYQWSLPEAARHVPDSVPGCMLCHTRFGLLEPRRHCGGCGGAFCGSHAPHVEGFNSRFCPRCRAQLAAAADIGVLQSRTSRAGSRATSRTVSRRPSIVLESAPVNASSGIRTPRERSSSHARGDTPSRSSSALAGATPGAATLAAPSQPGLDRPTTPVTPPPPATPSTDASAE